MNATTVVPFQLAITYNGAQFASDMLGNGLTTAASSANTADEFADTFARTYDKAVLGLVSGTLQQRPALNALTRNISLVARVPLAPFVTLVVLNIVFGFVGMVAVVLALFSNRRHLVTDTHVNLSISALIAQMFESSEVRGTTKSVDELFAERRGLETARVASTKQSYRGRALSLVEIGKGSGGKSTSRGTSL